jgi:hypothetical protein
MIASTRERPQGRGLGRLSAGTPGTHRTHRGLKWRLLLVSSTADFQVGYFFRLTRMGRARPPFSAPTSAKPGRSDAGA